MASIEHEIRLTTMVGDVSGDIISSLSAHDVEQLAAYVRAKLDALGAEIKEAGRLVEGKIAGDFYTISPEAIDAAVKRFKQ